MGRVLKDDAVISQQNITRKYPGFSCKLSLATHSAPLIHGAINFC